jgi:hypothetical protein
LKASRFDDYDDWLKIGMCLKNIDDSLLSVWDEFSRKSGKYKEGECQRLWNVFKKSNDGLSEGSLRFWAKGDNPEGYKAFCKEGVRHKVRQSIENFNDDSVAAIVAFKYKGKFIFANVRKQVIYGITLKTIGGIRMETLSFDRSLLMK